MAQQMVNGSHYDGSVTITNRMSARYAVVGRLTTASTKSLRRPRQKKEENVGG